MTIRTLAYGGLVLSLTALLAACGSQQRETTPVPATLATAEPAPPSASSPPPGVPPLPTDLLGAGSQQARDELYCSALIYAENPDLSDALAPVDEAQLRKRQALGFIIGESGINRLVTDKAKDAVKEKLGEKLGLTKPAANAPAAPGNAPAQPPAPQQSQQDKAKEKLRGLLGR